MNSKQLLQLGVPLGEPLHKAFDFISAYCTEGGDKTRLAEEISGIVANPNAFTNDVLRSPLALALLNPANHQRAEPASWKIWGSDLEEMAVGQMKTACLLPISVAGALMPDAHVGYGLPIGGVLATENAVIPYAVGVDIACRMKLTVLDIPATALENQRERLTSAIETETRFGVGVTFKNRRQHEVLDGDWSVSPITVRNKDKAWAQLGTSGSGNHFVEFGELTLANDELGLQRGTYLALLSHSGSRGTGAMVCDYYSKLATKKHPELPKEMSRLAWLALDTEEGREYWNAMELMGRYAAANHHLIHAHIAKNLGAEVLLDIENHHNFAWKENHFGREVVVHRKGATPADEGVLGIIPGSMASPGFVVRGKGNTDSLHSASHGAGRCMSRTRATQTFTWKQANKLLRERGVTLLSAGLDEVPMVYKDIHQVIAAQDDLIDVLARFDPRLVKMCPGGERPED